MRRQRESLAGQVTTETIVTIVLIALVAVIAIGVFGRTVMSKFLCAARAVASGESISAACGATESGKDRGADDPLKPGEGTDGKGGGPAAKPATGGRAGSGNPDSAQERLNEALEILASVGRGKGIVRFVLDNNVNIVFASGEGTFFTFDRTSGGTITLDDRSTTEDIIFAIAHEANHADFAFDGRTANAQGMSLDDFVDKMLDEETASVVAEIEVKKDLEAAGHTFSPLPFQFEEAFDAAFDQKLEELRSQAQKDRKRFNVQKAREEAKKAGAAAVKAKFARGQVTNSIDGRPYTEYYRDEYYRIVHGAGQPHLRLP